MHCCGLRCAVACWCRSCGCGWPWPRWSETHICQSHRSKPGHQPAAGPEPAGSADRDGAAGGALQLAGKGECLLGGDQPHLLDGLAAAAQELDLTGRGAELLDSWRIAVNHKQADFTDGALGNGHGWGGAENTDQTPRRRSAGQGRAPRASRQPWPARAAGACCGGVSLHPASQPPVATVPVPC